ncbi:MAG: hypothetical protein J5970_04920 [Bacilli bacterium]|nr:hypothetical protein [Bacilli bacterium]MBP3259443.1 hypothetical protein [Bacilli bacterium]
MKKKKIIIIVAIVVFILMLIPIPNRLKDGGSVEYNAVLYQYTKIHRLSEKSSTGYEDGWDLKILGFHIGGEINTYVQAECCDGCMCGDTLELIKNTESAWTLTEINDKGEYVYDHHSFINFHGTGKNKFAFFKNDDNSKPISEIRGSFSITRNADIVLTPDNSNKEIICKIGEEKDLIAVLECDNDFGTFTLQKEGKLELPSIIKDTVIKTKRVVITGNKNKTITAKEEIDKLVNIINNCKWWTGPTTSPSVMYDIELFDSNKNSIAKIAYTPGHYFTIQINNKYYNLANYDKDLLNSIIEK